MERHTADTLLEWFREKPRTLGWNVLVAYDRSHANAALIQEYITRFATGSYLRPITAKVEMSESEAQYLYGFTLDHPRLSFENATVKWSQARLTVKVVGGSQLTTRTPPGGRPQVIRVASYDALNGPAITMGLTLAVLLGSVDVQGRVAIDLSKGTEIDVDFADSRDHRRIGGEFFRTYFESLPDEQKVFVLGEIGSTAGQILKPRNVQIRTHAPAGSDGPDASDPGLGAVLMFLTMEGESFGTFPETDTDLQYLIPLGEQPECTATLVLGNQFVVRKFVEEGCRRMVASPAQFSFEAQTDERGFIRSLNITGGSRTGPALNTSLPSFASLHCLGMTTYMAAQGANEARFVVVFEDDGLSMEWTGHNEQPVELTTTQGDRHGENVRCSWLWRKRYRLGIDPLGGQLCWVPVPEFDVVQCKVAPLAFAQIPAVAGHFDEVAGYLEAQLAAQLNEGVADFVKPLEDLDVFRLNSILFRDRFIFEPLAAHLPGDLLVYGRIAPQATAFAVVPVEPLLGPGESLQFRVEPALEGVAWRVENVAGAQGDCGIIGASDGLYTAPGIAQIQGSFSRVRVTATRGDYSGSALLTVAVRDVTFNPLVVVCGAGQKCEMSAAARDGSSLQWSLAGQVAGSQILPSTEPGGDHTYFAPPAGQRSTEGFSLDQVHVRRPGQAEAYTSYVLVVHRPATVEVYARPDAELPEGSVRLVADPGAGPVEQGCVWTLLAGSGRIDSTTGVYSIDPAGQHRFALITVTIAPLAPIYPSHIGFMILALPLNLALAQHYSSGVTS